ncbi:MAG: hypothetical protein WC971_01580 [Coriobacteriia bacterium]
MDVFLGILLLLLTLGGLLLGGYIVLDASLMDRWRLIAGGVVLVLAMNVSWILSLLRQAREEEVSFLELLGSKGRVIPPPGRYPTASPTSKLIFSLLAVGFLLWILFLSPHP